MPAKKSGHSKKSGRAHRNISVDLHDGMKPKLQELAEKSHIRLTDYLRAICQLAIDEQLVVVQTFERKKSEGSN